MTPPPPSPTTHERPSASRFRFKQPSSHHSRSRSPTPDPYRSHRHHHRHHHHHRSKRRKLSSSPKATSTLNPETAFRESLFDALADDEGATFWEGVYGQPIHSYPRPSTTSSANDGTATGELDGMTDEEYVAYVRAKMWEKTHQHVIEERARREEERARRKKREEEGRRWEEGVEEALRRGEERRRRKRWKGAWEGYVRGWEGMVHGGGDPGGEGRAMRRRIPWPVLSGRWEDVGKDEVERFFRHAERYGGVREGGLGGLLKVERVRWHPDKMQQRAGKDGVDGETMKLITAVFQVIDRMWSETKSA